MIIFQIAGYLILALFLVSSDLAAQYLPRDVSLSLCVALGAIGLLHDLKLGGHSLMARIVLLSYLATVAPFIEFWIHSDGHISPPGRITYGMTEDYRLCSFVLHQYLLGLVAILLGFNIYKLLAFSTKQPELTMRLSKSIRSRKPDAVRLTIAPLPIAWYTICLGAIFIWYSLVIPRSTILTANYLDVRLTSGLFPQLAFTGLTPIFHLSLAYLFVDAVSTPNRLVARKIKFLSLAFVLLTVIVVFDLMRGNRSTAGLVVIIGVLFVTIPSYDQIRARLVGYLRQNRKKLILAGIAALLAFTVFTSITVVRRTLSGGNLTFSQAMSPLASVHKSGSWMGAVYGTFAMAEQYMRGGHSLENGKDYINLLLSLPPGPVARLFRYQRPIDLGENPVLWYDKYAQGGVHPILVPYRNFAGPGVLFHFLAYGLIVAWAENKFRGREIFGILIYCAFLEASFRWMWYGELNLVRPLMAAIIVHFVFIIVRSLAGTRSINLRGQLA